MAALPLWAGELVTLYESGAYSQFLISGNVHDRVVLPLGDGDAIRGLEDFLLEVLLPRFDVVLTYDMGNGIRAARGEEIFEDWPFLKEGGALPRTPRAAVEVLSHYLRYVANLSRLSGRRLQVACILRDADLVVPALQGGLHYDLNATASLIRDWGRDDALRGLPIATFLLTENRGDLHPLLVQSPRAAHLEVPLPEAPEVERALGVLAAQCPVALSRFRDDLARPAAQLAGATLTSIEALLLAREHRAEPLEDADLAELKKDLVERECNGLVEFVEPDRSLADALGHEAVTRWLRQDLALWRRGDLAALPMGYLLCGPVGTGKTFMAECLAGEAGIPVVKLRNFRDRWVGSTESNLERIFRLLHALGRCMVFVDEADQALGSRTAGAGDSGVSGRVYSMIADEMSDTRNRGRILWILASSRPDLIEVDLVRPGRIDVVLPLLPTLDAAESFALLRGLAARRGVDLTDDDFADLAHLVPAGMTPGSAEALAVKVYRLTRTEDATPREALRRCLADYQPPVPREVMEFQIRIAVEAASDFALVPPAYRLAGLTA